MDTKILSDLIIKDFYTANSFFSEKGSKNKRINRPSWAIVLKFEGETEYINKRKRHISNENNIAILPKGCTYEWKCIKSGKCIIIEFDADFSCEELFFFNIKDNTKILKLFKKNESAYLLKKSFYKINCISLTYEIIYTLLSSNETKYIPSDKHKRIQPAINCIFENYYIPLTNRELSILCGISEVYFRKIFTDIFGISPINYIHKIRIEKAKELFKGDFGKISDVATSVGYNNIYHFSKMFKIHTGVSPSEYIKKL